MNLYGILGFPLSHSKSKELFYNRFIESTDLQYRVFEYRDLIEFKKLLNHSRDIKGFNVTIPFKTRVVSWLSEETEEVIKTGACNTIKVIHNNNGITFKGHNTDVTGFKLSLEKLQISSVTQCLILGTGGASKAVEFVMNQLKINVIKVSRSANKSKDIILYQDIPRILIDRSLVVNCTPVGMYPNNDTIGFPYNLINQTYIFYDLVYNPLETNFLINSAKQGATVTNGWEMLKLQANEAWKFWGLI